MPASTDLLPLFASLRVADVRDAMDAHMLHHVGSMDPGIRPLWRTRACGIARTVRYVPFDGAIPRMTPAEYDEWAGAYYRDVCPYPWNREIQDGDFIVIDQSGVDAGLMGSENTLACVRRGARGFVTSGGVRDTDEIIGQNVPFWSRLISQSMVQGRLKYDARDVPVHVGGVLVHPGDVVVADGDGVIVVPQACAADVAERATAVHQADIRLRSAHYDALGLPRDDSVES
jgi:regulator of RNase E activity RraA